MIDERGLILYVDDDEPNRIVFEASFKDEFSIVTVSSGREALEVLEKEPVAVVITDQRMPEMSGLDLLAVVKERYPAIIRIVLSAYPDFNPVMRAANEQLVARFILKPWDEKVLREMLRWGFETFELGKRSASLQMRVMQTERLITLGSIHALMVHDIWHPLSFLRYNVQSLVQVRDAAPELSALLERHGGEIPPEARGKLRLLARELDGIVRDLDEGTVFIHDVVDNARRLLQSSPKHLPVVPADPVPVIRFVVALARSMARDRGAARAHIAHEGPPELPRVKISTAELTQVLLNLTLNGVEAILAKGEPGGLVKIEAASEEHVVVLVIRDDGVGMSRETIARLGTPFFSERGGSGLGVTQCLRLLGQAGGSLSFESTEGAGTAAKIILPRT
jgi:signal transduction histidine kinase